MSDEVDSTFITDDDPNHSLRAASVVGSQDLHFPQIDLDTSLESLLKHSYTSTSSTSPKTIMPNHTNPQLSLDDSWASLDLSDYAREDDARSENTDSASLADLTSTNDGESAAEEDNQGTVDEEQDANPQSTRLLSSADLQSSVQTEIEDLENTIFLERSSIQETPAEVDVVYRQPSSDTNYKIGSQNAVPSYETIRMTLSQRHLQQNGKPFRIAYFGTASAKEAQDLVLGKVGAALVAQPQSFAEDSNSSSPCYHIAPTEFGSGSKPYFAHLIPSQAQIIVDDITLLKARQPDSIDIALKDGSILSSRPTTSSTTANDSWSPDLLVVHMAREDVNDGDEVVYSIFELAQRHGLPVLAVADETPFDTIHMRDSKSLHKTLETQDGDGQRSTSKASPIDLESFLNLDAEQLNKHLALICRDRRNAPQADWQSSSTVWNMISCFVLNIPISAKTLESDTGGCYSLRRMDSTSTVDDQAKHEHTESQTGIQPGNSLVNDMLERFKSRHNWKYALFVASTWLLAVFIGQILKLANPPQQMELSSPSNLAAIEAVNTPVVVDLASRYSSASTTPEAVAPKIATDSTQSEHQHKPTTLAQNIWDAINLKAPQVKDEEKAAVSTRAIVAFAQNNTCFDNLLDKVLQVGWLFNQTADMLLHAQQNLKAMGDEFKKLIAVKARPEQFADRYRAQMQILHEEVTGSLSRLQDSVQRLHINSQQQLHDVTERCWNAVISIADKSAKQLRHVKDEQQRILHRAQKQVNGFARDKQDTESRIYYCMG